MQYLCVLQLNKCGPELSEITTGRFW